MASRKKQLHYTKVPLRRGMDMSWIEGTIDEVVSRFEALQQEISGMGYPTNEVYIENEGWGEESVYSLIHIRPETKEEKAKRLELERARKQLIEDRERETYEKLRQKYG